METNIQSFKLQFVCIDTMVYLIPDWPLGMSVSQDKVHVIEYADSVNITCLADCNPGCGYVWTDANGTVLSMDQVLYLDKPDRSVL